MCSAYKNDGKWDSSKYGKEPNTKINKTNSKITQFIKRVHGNYDPSSPLKIKETIAGRAVVQFKSWFFEAFAQRWEVENYDNILETTFKGRYRSVPTYMKEYTGRFGKIGAVIGLFKNALLLNIGIRKDFENLGLQEVDAANMRKLASELIMYLNMASMYIGLSLIYRDDEELEQDQEGLNITLNMINRVKNELSIYINPMEAVKMIRNPAPAMSLVEDLLKVSSSIKGIIKGEDTIETGAYAGQSRALRNFGSLIPGASSIKSISDNATQEYNKGLLNSLVKTIKSID